MIPEFLQSPVDNIGVSITGLAVYANVKLGFFKTGFIDFLLSPTISGILAIVISILSIAYLTMRIYDQFITTKLKKQAINGGK